MYRLIVYNVEYCEGILGRWYEYLEFWKSLRAPKGIDEKIVNSLKKFHPDIVALVEMDGGSVRSRGRDEVLFFEDSLHMRGVARGIKYSKKGVGKLFSFVPILRHQSNAIITDKKVKGVRYHFLSHGFKNLVIEARVYFGGKMVNLFLAHLALGKGTRKKQLLEIANIVNSVSGPVILMGDFNTFGGRVEIDELLDRTKLSCHDDLKKEMLEYTQPAFKPTRKLDYVLVSSDIVIKNYKVLNFEFSDHLPLLVDFEVKGNGN